MAETVDDRLLARLQELADRAAQVNGEFADPAVASDPVRSVALSKELAKLAFAVVWIPLIIGFLYYTVYLDRYNWSTTQFAGGTFNYDATAWQWFLLNFTNLLIIIFTLGFGIPFATVRSRRFLADHLAVAGNMQLSQVVQEAQKSSALGEGAADGFDIDIDIGI